MVPAEKRRKKINSETKIKKPSPQVRLMYDNPLHKYIEQQTSIQLFIDGTIVFYTCFVKHMEQHA
jgi:hypothetical protein